MHSGSRPWQATSPQFRDLFEKRAFGHFTTLMPGGEPQTTPVWVDYDGRCLVLNTAYERQKFRNLVREPRVAVSIQDPENPYRYLEVRGRVVETTTENAERHVDALSRRYLGEQHYPWRETGERRVLLKIEPQHTTSMP